MREIKTTTTEYLFQSTLYLISLLELFVVLFCCLFAPLVVGRIVDAQRHSQLETEHSIAAFSLAN